MATRSLSPLESKLILRLEWDKQFTITTDEAMRILDISCDHARQVLHRLARDNWLARIAPGKYELIPAERGEHAFTDPNALFIGSALASPYYFTYATAAFFHGLTTQAASLVYVAIKTGRPQSILVREKEYRLVLQPDHKFFGFKETDAYGAKVFMAQREKTILDCLDRPAYAGDIPDVVGMIQRGKSQMDWERLISYAIRFKTQVLLQRLGYLLELLMATTQNNTLMKLQGAITGNTKCYLGQPGKWGTGGKYHSTWKVIDNIPRQELFTDIEVQG